MKKSIFTIFFASISVFCFSQNTLTYRWYKGKKHPLERIDNKKFVLLSKSANLASSISEVRNNNLKVVSNGKNSTLQKLNPILTDSSMIGLEWMTIEGTSARGTNLNISDTVYTAPFYTVPGSKDTVGLSHLFYVKLNNMNDLSILENEAKSKNVVIVGQNRFMPLWFTLSCKKKTKGNALDMANYFYETNLFAESEADFMISFLNGCVNDPLFSDQWGLKNSGPCGCSSSYHFDIDYCDARQITQGSSDIIIAVFDNGLEFDHPDLTNMHPHSFNSFTGTSPSVIYGDHGMPCAGIIGANSNNNLGVSGIAPECPVMDISRKSSSLYPGISQDYADGINWGWKNGASVISNSWGSNSLQSQCLDNAIQNALMYGRGGLGSVVVFISQNDNNNSVKYPANSNPDILAVGAMSPCGKRKSPSTCDGETNWGSNYGDELDVIAPGVLIPSTDLQGSLGYNNSSGIAGNYVLDFWGTSAAAPHVAAIAGLILSLNPCLTQKEVVDIIESSSIKVRQDVYTYNNVAGRSNGLWHEEVGYGLASADAALNYLLDHYLLQDETVTSNKTIANPNGSIRAGRNVNPTQTNGDYVITSSANVELLSNEEISLEDGFEAVSGSEFEAYIDEFTGDCDDWGTSFKTVNRLLANNSPKFNQESKEISNNIHSSEPLFFPNPYSNNVNISFETQRENRIRIQIFDLMGQKLYDKQDNIASGKHNIALNLDFDGNVHLLRFCIGNEYYSEKMIKAGK